ncbi:hypothetical protein ACLOJK_004308, partial [Asimina triloba]
MLLVNRAHPLYPADGSPFATLISSFSPCPSDRSSSRLPALSGLFSFSGMAPSPASSPTPALSSLPLLSSPTPPLPSPLPSLSPSPLPRIQFRIASSPLFSPCLSHSLLRHRPRPHRPSLLSTRSGDPLPCPLPIPLLNLYALFSLCPAPFSGTGTLSTLFSSSDTVAAKNPLLAPFGWD